MEIRLYETPGTVNSIVRSQNPDVYQFSEISVDSAKFSEMTLKGWKELLEGKGWPATLAGGYVERGRRGSRSRRDERVKGEGEGEGEEKERRVEERERERRGRGERREERGERREERGERREERGERREERGDDIEGVEGVA
jgi:hypothetical protein